MTDQTTKVFYCLDGIARPTISILSFDQNRFDIKLITKITHGHGVASKASAKYPSGTIQLQYPFFLKLGLDLGHCYPGTLNLSISPNTYQIFAPSYHFLNIDWYPPRGKTENFLFADCVIEHLNQFTMGYVYQPDVNTKTEHYDDPYAFQIIAPHIPNLSDDSLITIYVSSQQIKVLN